MTYEPEMKRYLGFDSKDQLLGFYTLVSLMSILLKKENECLLSTKIIWKN